MFMKDEIYLLLHNIMCKYMNVSKMRRVYERNIMNEYGIKDGALHMYK